VNDGWLEMKKERYEAILEHDPSISML